MSLATSTESAVAQLLSEVRAAPVPALLDTMNPYNTTAHWKPPRPPNSFILFRAWVGRMFGERKVPIADHVWNALKREQSTMISHFHTLSREARAAHGNAFPDYKYCPKKKDSNATGKKGKRGGKKIRGGGGNATAGPSTTPSTSDHTAENVPLTSMQIGMAGSIWTYAQTPPPLFLPQPAHLEPKPEGDQIFAFDISPINHQQHASYEQFLGVNEPSSNILSHELEQERLYLPTQGYSYMEFGLNLAHAQEEDFTSGHFFSLSNLLMPSPRVGESNWYPGNYQQDPYSSSYHWPGSTFNASNINSSATDTSSPLTDIHSPNVDEDHSEFNRILRDLGLI